MLIVDLRLLNYFCSAMILQTLQFLRSYSPSAKTRVSPHWIFLLIGRRLFWSEAQRSFLTSLSSANALMLGYKYTARKTLHAVCKSSCFQNSYSLISTGITQSSPREVLISHLTRQGSVLKIQNCTCCAASRLAACCCCCCIKLPN